MGEQTEATQSGWSVVLYRAAEGRPVVEEEITSLGVDAEVKIARYVQLLGQFGLDLGAPYVRHVQGKLWELRPDAYRALYFATAGRRFVVVRAFRKTTQQTPPREIGTGERRMNEYEAR